MATEEGSNVRRVAFCSALCAGFAYVGYNMVSKIFFKTTPVSSKEEGSNDEIVSKYLSKSIQTDPPIIATDFCDVSKTVRERVKDLNVMVQQFRKNSVPLPLSPEVKSSSTLCSPWSSPLGCAKYLSYSAENISSTSPLSSPEHKKRIKPVRGGKSTESLSTLKDNHRYNALTKIPLPQDLEITVKTLRSLQKVPRKMTLFETRNMISLLYSTDEDILVKTLTTVSNCAAFSSNQEQLCHAGCADRLFELLQHPSEPVKVASAQAVSNIVVMEKGYHYFRTHIPILFSYSKHGGELLKSISLTALANLALNDSSHNSMIDDVNSVVSLAENGNSVVQLQALRLLVNLSCNKEMIPFLLLTKVSPCLFDLIHTPNNREVTLRLITFLANVLTFAVQDLRISSRSTTLMSFLYRIKEQSEFEHIIKLSDDSDEDMSFQARRLCDALRQKPN